MNGKIINDILTKLNKDSGDYTIEVHTKTNRTIVFQSTGDDNERPFSFVDKDMQVIKLETDIGTKWVDVESIESVEI